MKHLVLALTATAACLTALPAAAQFQKAEDAIKYRQAAMTLMSAHFGRVAAMAQGKVPFDAKAAAENAALAQTMSTLPFEAYGPGTDAGRPTRAKAEIWTDAAGFKKADETMEKAMVKLAEAAKSGSLDAIKGTVGDVGKACKGCHDDYRSEQYSK